jgi:hypothetical protein
VDSDPDMLKLERRHYNAAREVLEDSSFLDRIERFNFPLTAILDPIIRSILCTGLFHTIFKPFFPGLTPQNSGRCFKAYNEIDPEDQAQRVVMRNNFYQNYTKLLRRPLSLLDHIDGCMCAPHTDINRCIEEIFNVIKAFTGTGMDILTRGKYESDATKIFERAFQLQIKAKMEYARYGYDIFASGVGDAFAAFQGEAIQGLPEMDPRVIWLCVGLGMKANRYNLPEAVCVKAPVICDNWDPIC